MDTQMIVARVDFERMRYRATARLLGSLRHGLAAPLSGAALHLELATRKLSRPPGSDPGASHALENVRVAQAGVGRAADLLQALAEIARSAEDPLGELCLAEAIRRGAEGRRGDAGARRVSLEGPDASGAPDFFGARRQIEEAASELTRHALASARADTTVVWTVGRPGPVERVARLTWTPESPEEGPAPERLFELAPESGDGHDLGRFLARWYVESHAGQLSIGADRGLANVTMRFPAAGVA